MLLWKESIGFFVVMCTYMVSISPVIAQESIVPTLEGILKEFHSIEKRLVTEKKQIRFDFIVETGKNPTPSKFSEAPFAFEWCLLRNGDLWKLKTRDTFPELHPHLADGKPVVTKGWSTSAINGSFLFLRNFDREVAVVYSSETKSTNVFHGIEYHTFLGYNLGKEIVKSMKQDYTKALEDPVASHHLKDIPFLPNYLEEHRDSYHVLPDSETVDGHLCWVVENPNMDKLWIAPDLGYMLCKRRFHWGHKKPLRMEIRAKEFKEIEPGLFFPMAIEVDKYAAYEWEDEAIWNKITGQSVYRVKNTISFSNVTNEDLAIELPIGTRVVDEVRGIEYVVQKEGVDPFAGAIEMGLKRARLTLFRLTMMILGGILILCALFRMWYEHKRNRSSTLSLIVFCLMPFSLNAKEPSVRTDDGTFDWKSAWREAGDCGPGALYVLMKLERRNVSFDDIKRHLTVDPVHGCSMELLYNTSQQMGFPADIRFVPPSKIMEIPCPFILHGISGIKENIGHFIVVLEIDPKTRTATIIDPSQERFSQNPIDSVLQNYSGYILVPRYSSSRRWNLVVDIVFVFCGFGCFVLIYRYTSSRHRPVQRATDDLKSKISRRDNSH